MASIVDRINEAQKLDCPPFVLGNTQYEVMMGSIAYGTSNEASDIDVYGFCVPPKEYVYPHLAGAIEGFGTPPPKFDQYQKHHLVYSERDYDLNIYGLPRYMHLVMENNPNMVDSLFVPDDCVLHITPVGQHIRDNRRLFLHRGYKFKAIGVAHSQVQKLKTKNPEGKRVEIVEKYGFDVKFAAHAVRLVLQAEQVLQTHDLDLRRDKEKLKLIRNGEWSKEQVLDWFNKREIYSDELYQKSDLRYKPDELAIKNVLLECLEMVYGSVDRVCQCRTLKANLTDVEKRLQSVIERIP